MGTFIFIMIVTIIVCALLVLVILSQNPKGGGLSSTFGGGGSQMFGVQRTNDFLDKATWTLSILIAVLVIISNFVLPREASSAPLPELQTQEEAAPATTEPATDTATPLAQPETPATENTPAK